MDKVDNSWVLEAVQRWAGEDQQLENNEKFKKKRKIVLNHQDTLNVVSAVEKMNEEEE